MKKNTLLIIVFVILHVTSGFVNKLRAQKNVHDSYSSNASFLFLSDIHLNMFTDTTAYGLDTGIGLWTIFLAKADSLLGSSHAPGFIVYTGDLPAHYKCSPATCYLPDSARQSHNHNLATILSGLRNLATKHNTPFFYIPGNNDGLAGDYYSFADEQQQTPFSVAPSSKNPYPALYILPGTSKAPCTHPLS